MERSAPHVPVLSVVVPVYNEEEVLPAFYERLSAALAGLPCEAEIVFVDDGSRDRTAEIVSDFARHDTRVRLFSLTRNFGHQAALRCGLEHARGDAVVTIDADLQDPPELIGDFHARWRAGFDVVYGQRRGLQTSVVRRVVYGGFYRVLRMLADIEIPVDTGDFCLMDREVVRQLVALRERTGFLRGLRSWVGFRQTAVEYFRPARHRGESKYSLSKLLRLATDGIFSFSTLPLRLTLCAGALVALAGVTLGAVLWLRDGALGGTGLVAALVLVVGGLQLGALGLMGEYVARIYDEAKARPTYLVARRSGLPAAGAAPQGREEREPAATAAAGHGPRT